MVRKILHDKLDNWTSGDGEKLKKLIDRAEWVSFDIFDTLLKRDVPTPVDVFSIVEKNNNILNYKKLRIEAERKSRNISQKQEVTLQDIMECLKVDNLSYCRDCEMIAEMELSTVNRNLLDIYNYCVANKKVILVSDTYLPREILVNLLGKIGITGYKRLYISNEIGKTKADGSLFEYVKDDLGVDGKKILHIGNSFKADYFQARAKRVNSFKIKTDYCRTRRQYKNSGDKYDYLSSFINNHIHTEYTRYGMFGYEAFGPLLYGFINWLYNDAKQNGIQQIFFLARDGYIMQKAYHEMEFHLDIPDYYFEASRRSLRIPAYNRSMSFEDVLRELTVPNKTNLIQIFDSLGLNIESYENEVKKSGLNKTEHLKRDLLSSNDKFKELFNTVYDDIMNNAEAESKMLVKYLEQFDFSKKTAIVDIGWGGSMQKYLTNTLNKLNIRNEIYGYYIGLTAKAIDNLGINNFHAKGYVFDVLNNKNDFDMERPFVGLFETLFLEQGGSVKRYMKFENQIIAERYQYEYIDGDNLSKEAMAVRDIQLAAIDFVKEFKNSPCSIFIGNSPATFFSNLYEIGINPTLDDIDMFGDFVFFNNGSKVYLAKPNSILHYLFNSRELARDLFDSQWKIGFLKSLLKIRFPYLKLFNLLRKASN